MNQLLIYTEEIMRYCDKKILIISLIICGAVLLIFRFHSEAATYYIDSGNGNDGNSGLSLSSPWKTINKVNNMRFSSGDSILFKRGGVWREKLTIPSSGDSSGYITFSSYGTGNNPVIIGSNSIIGWTQNNNKWIKDIINEP